VLAQVTHWRVKQVARSPEPRDVLADPPGSLRALAHGKAAGAWLFWSNWCGPGATPTGDHGTPPSALRHRLANSTTLSIALSTRAPRYDAPQAPSKISVGPLRPVSPSLPPSSRLPLRLAIVKARVHRFLARRGRPFRYRVAITNTAAHTLGFGGGCPAYVEQLVGSGPALAYVLNCHEAGPIAPRQNPPARTEDIRGAARPGSGLGQAMRPRPVVLLLSTASQLSQPT